MRIGLVRTVALIFVLLLCGSALAQQPLSSPSGSLESILTIEDPSTRITALQRFIKTNTVPEQSRAAREAIVASWAQLAEIQLGENNIEKAVADFRKAIAALPENVTDRFFEETVVRIPQAVSARGYRNEAIGLARQLEKRFAKEPLRLAGIGEFCMTVEASADAIRILEIAVKLDGGEARLRRSLGAAYRMGLRLDEAVAEYQQTIKIDPDDKRAYYELANLYRAHGSYDDAVRLYQKQLEIEPKHSPSYKGMALAYLAQGDDEHALAALNQARDLRDAPEEITKDIYLQTQMAFYYLAQSRLKQARQAAESALLIEPRYAWARIAAAEVGLAEGKYFDAERNLLSAQQYANFPTLFFTFGKLYLGVEDFDGALEQFAKAFSYSPQKQFTTKLGGILDLQADNLKELLSREHQASLFLAESPTSEEQFKIAESLVRFNAELRAIKSSSPARTGRTDARANPDPTRKRLEELDQTAMDFIDAEKTRRSFRALHIAQQLARAGVLTGTATELADQALGMAEVATEFDGSLRDYPNYDRDGRLRIFRGRALDAKGWALFKAGKNDEAVVVLSEAAQAYGPLPEGKRALWHLAAVKETIGELREALNLYIAGYEPPSSSSAIDVNRTVIEGLYRNVNGSLEGLDERLKRAANASGTEIGSMLASLKPAEKDLADVSTAKPDDNAIKSSEKSGPPPDSRNGKNDSQFKFSSSTFAKARRASSDNPPQAKSKSVGSQLAVPLSDPMFAKKPSSNENSDAKSSDPVTEVTAASSNTPEPPPNTPEAPPNTPEAPPITRIPVELPAISAELDHSPHLPPIMNQNELIAFHDDFKIGVDEETPPTPPEAEINPAAQTRKRRITPDIQILPRLSARKRGITPDTQISPRLHTRKRRVTPDIQILPRLHTRKRRVSVPGYRPTR
jgi:tetratricopeptide (TPR) repeat protein